MASTLHVLLYHPERLPVTRYGGTERVVVWLARGLAELGHKVTIICGRGSKVPEAQIIPIATGAGNRAHGGSAAVSTPGRPAARS